MEAFELRLCVGRIGRWLTIDPYHEFFSPYVGMGNNPINLIDPDGGATTDPVLARLGAAIAEMVFWANCIKLDEVVVTGKFQMPSWASDFANNFAYSALGMGNAWASNNLLGAFRANPEDFGQHELAMRIGMLGGDLLSIATGSAEMFVGGGMMLGGAAFALPTGGATTVVSVGGAVVAAHGTSVVFNGTINTVAGINGLVNYFATNNHGSGGSSGGDGSNIPKKILTDEGKVDISKFTQKQKGSQSYKDNKTGWSIERDHLKANSHGGSFWKLKNSKGDRVATLAEDGTILRQ